MVTVLVPIRCFFLSYLFLSFLLTPLFLLRYSLKKDLQSIASLFLCSNARSWAFLFFTSSSFFSHCYFKNNYLTMASVPLISLCFGSWDCLPWIHLIPHCCFLPFPRRFFFYPRVIFITVFLFSFNVSFITFIFVEVSVAAFYRAG